MTLRAKLAYARLRYARFHRAVRIARNRVRHYRRLHLALFGPSHRKARMGRKQVAWKKRLHWAEDHEKLWERRVEHYTEELRHLPPKHMYDDTTISLIPKSARAVAGYVGGLFHTYPSLLFLFPKAKHVSIAINDTEDADFLDIENGDAEIWQAPDWVRRQKARGKSRPGLYCSVSSVDELIATMAAAGFQRHEYRIWAAHYGDGEHICGPSTCGECSTDCDACQYTDVADEESLDESLLKEDFFS